MAEKCDGSRVCEGSYGPAFLNIPLPNPETPQSQPDQTKPSPGCTARGAEADPLARAGNTCPESSLNECSDFELEGGDENCLIDDWVRESMAIGGATVNVFKLLGIHEQGRLVDCSGHGSAISGGYLPRFEADNAFTKYENRWKSVQRGDGILASSFIGYDFGEIQTNNSARPAYGVETYVMKHINAIKIKQSDNPNERITEARIERSSDGKKWYGVARITLPDDDCLNTIFFNDSVPSRFWRIRPITFSGGINDRWSVVAVQMFHNYVATDQHNIQDKVFLENRDRDYDTEGEPIKGYYDLYDSVTEVGNAGIELTSQSLFINVSFSRCVELFGRPIVIGDVLEIPAEAMYSSKMRRIEKWLMVMDVSWSTEGYTPGWNPTMLRLIAEPAVASQETQDIFGDLATNFTDEMGLVDQETGDDPVFQDYFDASQTMTAEARDAVPERGREGSSTIRAWEEDEIAKSREPGVDENGRVSQQGVVNLQKIGLEPNGLFVEDAMPPNNAEFTQNDVFPNSPKHGDYHRLTYDAISTDIPPRLFRYSEVKGRWVYLETDRRKEYNSNVPMIQEFKRDPRGRSGDEITRAEPHWRQRIRKSCDVVKQTTDTNEVPPETKDGTDGFEVHDEFRADNTLKPNQVVDPLSNNSGDCPEDDTND